MLSPEQIAKIRQKEAATPDALKRDPLSMYTEGWFHVTLNVRDEAPVLGYITGDAEAPDGSANAPRCVLTELGRKVEEVIASIPSFHKYTSVEAAIVMPDHLHMLLHLLPGGKEHLGKVIGGFMGGCSHEYWDVLGIDWRKDHPTQGRVDNAGGQRSAAAHRLPDRDRDHTRSFRGPSLFVRGYNDVEAIGEDEIEIKRQYIHNNPRKHLIQRNKRDLFCIHRLMTSANWTPERIMLGLCADRFIAADRSQQVEAWRQVTTKGIRNCRGKVNATLNFQIADTSAQSANTSAQSAEISAQTASAIANASTSSTASYRSVIDFVGNMELLKRPLFPLVCHRADAHLYEQQKAAVLKVAREQGGVIVTACVSPKERDIVKLLLQELLPVIEVVDNGFSDRYKPTGRNFYAVAEGRRLEVSPWEYEYHHRNDDDSPNISREMCMVMNEVVRTIARKPDNWWK